MELVSREDAKAHTRSCPALTPGEDCTCGLEWRIALRTEQEQHNAWRKRADEAERELARCKPVVDAAVEVRKAKLAIEEVRSNPGIKGVVEAVALHEGVQILKEHLDVLYEAVRDYEAGERAPEYSATEQECKGCMGPCGRCEEASDAG